MKSKDEANTLDFRVAMPERHVRLLVPGEHHWDLLQKVLVQGRISGPSVTVAAIAAITLEYGGVLYTLDRVFARLPGLRWINPLQTS